MKTASNTVLGLSMSAGALIAAVGLSLQAHDFNPDIQAAPVAPAQFTPEPPSPPPPSPPPPATAYNPNQDYWTGQGSGGGAPGGGGG